MIRLLRNVLFLLFPSSPFFFSLDGLQKKSDIQCHPVGSSNVGHFAASFMQYILYEYIYLYVLSSLFVVLWKTEKRNIYLSFATTIY